MVTVAGGDFKVETFAGSLSGGNSLTIRTLEDFEYAVLLVLRIDINSTTAWNLRTETPNFFTKTIVSSSDLVNREVRGDPFKVPASGKTFPIMLPKENIIVQHSSSGGANEEYQVSILVIS